MKKTILLLFVVLAALTATADNLVPAWPIGPVISQGQALTFDIQSNGPLVGVCWNVGYRDPNGTVYRMPDCDVMCGYQPGLIRHEMVQWPHPTECPMDVDFIRPGKYTISATGYYWDRRDTPYSVTESRQYLVK